MIEPVTIVKEAAERIARAVVNEVLACYHESTKKASRTEITPLIAAELTALLAERDALLRECREYVAYGNQHSLAGMDDFELRTGYKPSVSPEELPSTKLLARIDAILGKEGDSEHLPDVRT